jgi:hypothetical protein
MEKPFPIPGKGFIFRRKEGPGGAARFGPGWDLPSNPEFDRKNRIEIKTLPG